MLAAEDLEDVDHGDPGLFGMFALVLHHGEEMVESGLVFAVSGEGSRQLYACPTIVGVGVNASFEGLDVASGCCLDPGGGLQTLYFRIGNEAAKNHERFVGVAAIDEQRGQAVSGLAVIRAGLEYLAKEVLGGGVVSVEPGGACLIHHEVVLIRHERGHPVRDRRLRQRTGESRHFLAVSEGNDGGNALHRVLL